MGSLETEDILKQALLNIEGKNLWKPCSKNIELKIFVSKDSSEVGWKTGWWWKMAVLIQQHVNKALQILYLSSQYDGGNIEQRTIGYG